MTLEDIDLRRKRAVFRSWHRGTREMDLILGRFAEDRSKAWTPADIATYEGFLEENDSDIYDWLTGRAPPPDSWVGWVSQIVRYHKIS